MASFVLVHGSWHGGWCWQRLTPLLERAGHQVYTPTLAGCGERRAEAAPELGVEAHLADLLGWLDSQGLGAATLVGHSYAGLLISGVADRAPERVERLIFLDAFIPQDGAAIFDLMPPLRAMFEQAANEAGDGWLVPPVPPELLGLSAPADSAWAVPQLTPMPLRTHAEPLRLAHALGNGRPCHYIRCTQFPLSEPFGPQARALGWPYQELATGHDAMITAPEALATALLACCAEPV